jgi:hypothetical protein
MIRLVQIVDGERSTTYHLEALFVTGPVPNLLQLYRLQQTYRIPDHARIFIEGGYLISRWSENISHTN